MFSQVAGRSRGVYVDWLLVARIAIPLSVLGLVLVSVRWEMPGGAGPLYGFPLPYTWAAPQPRAWRLDLMALVIDWCAYLAAALAASLILDKLLPRARSLGMHRLKVCSRVALDLGAVAVVVALLVLPTVSGRLSRAQPPKDAPASKALWIGLPAPR